MLTGLMENESINVRIKKNRIFFLLIISFISLIIINNTDPNYIKKIKSLYKFTVPIIQPKDLYKIIDNENIYILDTRTEEEYNVSHIKNAVFAGFKNFDINKFLYIPKNAKIIVYCSVGYRSEKIGEKLLKAGHTDVFNLFGGIFEWINQDFKIYDKHGETTRIHGYSKNWSKWLKKGDIVY